MLLKRRSRNKGFTLIEILISLTISLLLLNALIGLFSLNVGYSSRLLSMQKLNAQLQGALQLMANDIRRAGYWSNASNDLGATSNSNPFMSVANGTDINTPSSSCILFTYDRDGSGTLPSISSSYDDKRYGYRLSNQTLQTRPFGASFSCNAAASAWENVTDSNAVLITNLTFTLSSSTVSSGGTTSLVVRKVLISMTGRLANDSSITKTVSLTVKVRNDRFTPP